MMVNCCFFLWTFDDFRDIVNEFSSILSRFHLKTLKDPICGSMGDRKKAIENETKPLPEVFLMDKSSLKSMMVESFFSKLKTSMSSQHTRVDIYILSNSNGFNFHISFWTRMTRVKREMNSPCGDLSIFSVKFMLF